MVTATAIVAKAFEGAGVNCALPATATTRYAQMPVPMLLSVATTGPAVSRVTLSSSASAHALPDGVVPNARYVRLATQVSIARYAIRGSSMCRELALRHALMPL